MVSKTSASRTTASARSDTSKSSQSKSAQSSSQTKSSQSSQSKPAQSSSQSKSGQSSFESKPAQSSQTKSSQSSQAKPAESSQSKSAQSSQIPGQKDEFVPAADASKTKSQETKPQETKPAQSGETKPAQKGETKPAQSSETKPAQNGETKPAQNGETKPAQNGETKPAQNGETKPAQNGETKPREIGSLSRRYESNGNPATVSTGRGDPGGKSYGAYQLSSKKGTATEYSNYLNRTNPDLAKDFAGKKPGTAEFDAAWKQAAARDPEGFLRSQHDFIKQSHYDPAAEGVKKSTGLDVSQRSDALRDVMWSTAVQHRNGASGIVQKALAGRDPNTMTDNQIIDAIYAERGRKNASGKMVYFGKSSPAVQRGVSNRFENERRDAQKMLAPKQ